MPGMINGQPSRFATMLFYLNDDMEGGETSFPRYVNAESFRELKVTPVAGKAILFYSQLPDGNLDDFSQHAAQPVIDGEKVMFHLFLFLTKCFQCSHSLGIRYLYIFSILIQCCSGYVSRNSKLGWKRPNTVSQTLISPIFFRLKL